MKIKCYGPEVLNEESKEYLLNNLEISGKFNSFLKKIIKVWSYVFILVFLLLIFFTSQGMSELETISFNLLTILFVFILFIFFLYYVIKLRKKINKDFNGVLENLIEEMVLVESYEEKNKFYKENENSFFDKLKTFYKKDIVYGSDKVICFKSYNKKCNEGEISNYIELEEEDYIILKIIFRIENIRMKGRNYIFLDYFAIISREDYNKFKEMKENYIVKI